jgi:lactoylglutathione lyase
MAKPVHSMIRVLDEAKSLDFYARAFGLEVADHLKFSDFALIYLRHPSSPFEVELTVNFDRKEPYSLGDGYGHLAVVVDNVDAEHARFEREKLSPGPWRDACALFLRRRPRRLQDRGDPEGRPLRLITINKTSNGGDP